MKKIPLIVELVGLPGAGKTTFVKALDKFGENVTITSIPYFRKIEHLPFFATNTLLLLPTFLRIHRTRDGKWLTPRDQALMVILSGWHHVLKRKRSHAEKMIILDEGPICYLTRLYAFGSESIKGQSAQNWWDHAYRLWAETLDVVIRFDVPDSILVERIRSRDAWQEIKQLSDADAYKWMACIRSAQEHVLNTMKAEAKCAKFLTFNTAQKSPDQIFDEIVDVLDLSSVVDHSCSPGIRKAEPKF